MKFVHVSDLHLVEPGAKAWGLDHAERVDRCLDDIVKWHGDAAFCVITGDLADRGEPAAYAWLRERLARFPIKTFLLIGNHDDPKAFGEAFPDQPRDANGFFQSRHRTEAGVFLFLDTYKGPTSEGRYCAARQAWLRGELERADGAPVWIFMHHPPFDVALPYMDRIKLDEAQEFGEIVAGHSNIRHLFFGHIHRAAFIHWQGIPCTSLPALSSQVPLVAESVNSLYSLEPAMYGVVFIEDDKTIVHFDAGLDRKPAGERDG